MKNYQVILAKSYIITMEAENALKAIRLAEFYTGDIADISTNQDRERQNFKIKRIVCGINDGIEVEEVSSD